MNRIVFDWSLRRGVVAIVISDDGIQKQYVWPSTSAMLDSLTEPHEIIGESTFESYILENRTTFAARCAREGHALRTLPPRLTPRWRRSLGLVKIGGASDDNDVAAMIELAKDETRLSVYHEPDADQAARMRQANRYLMLLRATGEKEDGAHDIIARLPAFEDQPEVRRKALGEAFDNKNHRPGFVQGWHYNSVKVAAVAVAAAFSGNQREFDQLSGLYAHAYPSQIRADLMHWGWSGGSKRGRLVKELDPSGETSKPVPVVPSRRVDGLALTDYRRELRWLYRQIRTLDAPERWIEVRHLAMG